MHFLLLCNGFTGAIPPVTQVAAFIVSLVALLTAASALFFTRRADSRGQDQEKREQRRFQREEADARARQEARPSAGYLNRVPDRRRAYRFRVTNIGQATARDLEATLIDGHGNVVSDQVPGKYVGEGRGLLQSDESIDFELAVREDALDHNPVFLHFSWTDDRSYSPRSHTSKTEVPSD